MKLHAEVDSVFSPLTKKENQIFSMLAEGLSQREMSERLHRSFATVSTHIEHIKQKLDADNSTQAVSIGVARGFLRFKHLLVVVLVAISTINAILPITAMASDAPFVRVRVRGGGRVRNGANAQLRTATRGKRTGE